RSTSPDDYAQLVRDWSDALYIRHNAESAAGVRVGYDPVKDMTDFGLPLLVRKAILDRFARRVDADVQQRFDASGLLQRNREFIARVQQVAGPLKDDATLRGRWGDAVRHYPAWHVVEAYFKVKNVPAATQATVRSFLIELGGASLPRPGAPLPGVD